jgi:catechol 2,3-dioxygenase-like lactoylglutathione lyase family enzyme
MHLSLIALVVDDYHKAIAYYVGVLGFVLVEDTSLTPEKRWVVVSPSKGAQTRLLLARAANERQSAAVGKQSGGRVFLFLETDDFDARFAALTAAGVKFTDGPRRETYGTVAVFEDLYGNRWDLIERR